MAYIVKQPAKGGRTHVHLAENHHNSEKGGARQTRQHVGVLSPQTNELILGRAFPEPTKELLSLLAAKGIEYKGARSKGPGRKRIRASRPTPVSSSPLSVEETGRISAFRGLSGSSGLSDSLKVGFGEKIGGRILDLAIFQACEGGAFYLADAWAEDVGMLKGFSSSSISRLCDSVGKDGTARDRFYKAWIEANGMPRALIHDTTSISTYSSELEDAEWGYNRDGDKLPQVNLALVVSRDERLPLWFRTVPGSIPDVSTLKLTCRCLQAFGLNDFSCSLDRGYFSNSNLLAMLKSGIGFTIGVPMNLKQAGEIIKSSRRLLRSTKRSFLYQGKRMRYAACNYSIKVEGSDDLKLSGYLYFDPERHELSASRLEEVVLELEQKAKCRNFSDLAAAHDWISENGMRFASYLAIKQIGGMWMIIRKPNAVSRAISRMGMTLVATTNSGQSPEEALGDYRCRDIAEKIFSVAKNGVGADRMRSGKSNNVQGRLFIAFVSLTLRSLLEGKLKTAGVLNRFSVDECLVQLSKIRRVRLADGTTAMCEIPKKTRTVAQALSMTV